MVMSGWILLFTAHWRFNLFGIALYRSLSDMNTLKIPPILTAMNALLDLMNRVYTISIAYFPT